MARFHPLYVRRSDGKIEVVAKGKRKELNQPTDEQLDQKPDKDGVSDFYREVAPDEPKHLDWRRKLGGMLARELDWKDKSGGDHGHILVAFPENYRLYEHVKRTEKDGKLEVKSKTHAAGGNDRQDAYLYGHPTGRRKRFRSPNDFFPHLLWLCNDESGDPDNCSCKICSPEDLENLLPAAKPKQERPTTNTNQTLPPMARQISQQGTKVKQEPVAPTPRPATAIARQPTATPFPPPKNMDQKWDRQYNAFMYRTGELAWFRRGQAWGLGLIVRRWTSSGTNASVPHHYQIQPLSHPYSSESRLIVGSNAEMRPWLAWSVPKFTNQALNDTPNPPVYASADWQGIMQRRYGTGDIVVDASILAAKAVDATYTLFDKNRTVEPEAGLAETQYNGIFLGAEKIWVGDPVRLHVGSGTDIMVVHSIVESKRISAMNNQVIQQSIRLIGDVYSLAQVAHSNPQVPTPAAPQANPDLPPRLTEDLAYRNSRTIAVRRAAQYWKLAGTQQRVDINQIKGRWYEASLLLPIVDAHRFEEANRKGEIQESSLWMNSRGDCVNSNRPAHLPKLPRETVRKMTRKEAYDRSIPPDVEIRDGIGPPQPDNVDPMLAVAPGANHENAIEIDPRFDTADGTEGPTHHDANAAGGTFDELMNLDDMDDHAHLPGFEQDFDGQGSGPGYF